MHTAEQRRGNRTRKQAANKEKMKSTRTAVRRTPGPSLQGATNKRCSTAGWPSPEVTGLQTGTHELKPDLEEQSPTPRTNRTNSRTASSKNDRISYQNDSLSNFAQEITMELVSYPGRIIARNQLKLREISDRNQKHSFLPKTKIPRFIVLEWNLLDSLVA